MKSYIFKTLIGLLMLATWLICPIALAAVVIPNTWGVILGVLWALWCAFSLLAVLRNYDDVMNVYELFDFDERDKDIEAP